MRLPLQEAPGTSVELRDLQLGELLAEGGEGRVFELPRQPHLVYKAYRNPQPAADLADLVEWASGVLSGADAATVEAACAWPSAVVTGPRGQGFGLLVPRAPRRFALRHRDGQSRLASLSYLTADPAQRAAAYGLDLPPAASPERIGLLYALARLLAVFESARPAVGHGDLSTKNVLWSLQRGPEIFVIDCDNAARFGPGGEELGRAGRRRAMTPNWDDPVVARGGNPTIGSDRYSLALVFLRVVGAANFPMQARQRAGGPLAVEVQVPSGPRAGPLLDPRAPVWNLCGRGLSMVDPPGRPPAASWVANLAQLLRSMGAEWVVESVDAAHGSSGQDASELPGRRHEPNDGPDDGPPGDVAVRPVAAGRPPKSQWSRGRVWSIQPGRRAGPGPSLASGSGRRLPAGSGAPFGPPGPPVVRSGTPAAGTPSPAVWPDVVAGLRRAWQWWAGIHVRAGSSVAGGQGGETARALIVCALVDLLLVIVALFVVAMVAAPLLGI